jgi:uncharacterized protein YndB with AHSA1/START domain
MISLRRITEFEAPPSTVWNVVVDLEAWPRYAPVRSVVIEQRGDRSDGSGVGQVRALKTWAGTVREQVTAFEPPSLLSYTLLSGAPVQDYRGTVTLEPSGTGTRHTWEIQFDTRWFLAPLLTLITRRTIKTTVQGLGSELTKRPTD